MNHADLVEAYVEMHSGKRAPWRYKPWRRDQPEPEMRTKPQEPQQQYTDQQALAALLGVNATEEKP